MNILVPTRICKAIKVSGADYASCSGLYKLSEGRATWAPEKPVYKHISKERYIVFRENLAGWKIASSYTLFSGFYFGKQNQDAVLKIAGRSAYPMLQSTYFVKSVAAGYYTCCVKYYAAGSLPGGPLADAKGPWQAKWKKNVKVECIRSKCIENLTNIFYVLIWTHLYANV